MTAHTCTFQGCTRPLVARGYCHEHWRQLRRGHTLKPILRDQPRPAHTCTTHPAGTATCYRWDGCRCGPCRDAHTRQRKHSRPGVDATGTSRRIRALVAIGWTLADLDAHLGYRAGRCYQTTRRTWVTGRVAAEIAALYDRLWDQPGPSSTSRRRAAANGWAAPLAWDDDAGPHGIDNPAATPCTPAGRETTFEQVLWLVDGSQSLAAICAQLGIGEAAVEQACRRAGRADVWQRINTRKAA